MFLCKLVLFVYVSLYVLLMYVCIFCLCKLI